MDRARRRRRRRGYRIGRPSGGGGDVRAVVRFDHDHEYYVYIYGSKEQQQEASIMKQVLEHNAGHRAPFIQKALGTFPDADKASDKAVFEKTQEVIKDEVRG